MVSLVKFVYSYTLYCNFYWVRMSVWLRDSSQCTHWISMTCDMGNLDFENDILYLEIWTVDTEE
jgi:hypothetical protein